MKNETDTLNEKIVLLQNEQVKELKILTEQFNQTYESLKPINLIKSTLYEVSSSIEIKNSVLRNSIGLATGYLIKEIFIGKSNNPIKKMLGLFLQFSIANFVAKHSDKAIEYSENLIQSIFKRTPEKKE